MLVQRVRDENRQDVQTQLRSLSMDAEGFLSRGSGKLFMTPNSLKQVIARTDCTEPYAAATYLATIPPDRRAKEVNHLIQDTSADKTLVLRTRTNTLSNDQRCREIYATVSEKYNLDYDIVELARIVGQRLHIMGDARADIRYDGLRAEINLLYHSNILPSQACAGEIFKAIAGIRTTDDGTMSIHPFAGLHRNLCLNFLIIDQAQVKLAAVRHQGVNVGSMIFTALEQAVDRVRFFADKWDSATHQDLHHIVRDVPAKKEITDGELVAGVYRGLIKGNDGLALPGYRGEKGAQAYTNAWKKEPVLTRAGIVNGLTRAAHELPLNGEWSAERIQSAAGQVVISPRPFNWIGESGEDF